MSSPMRSIEPGSAAAGGDPLAELESRSGIDYALRSKYRFLRASYASFIAGLLLGTAVALAGLLP